MITESRHLLFEYLFPIENVRKIINPSPIDQSKLQWDYKRISDPATIHWIWNQILGTRFFFNPDRIGLIIWQSTKNVAIRLQFQINPNLTAHRQVLGLESRAGSYPCPRGLHNPTGRPQSPKTSFSESLNPVAIEDLIFCNPQDYGSIVENLQPCYNCGQSSLIASKLHHSWWRCEAIRQNFKPILSNWDKLQTAAPSITVGLYETFNPSTILADWKGNHVLVQFCHNPGPRPHKVTDPIHRHVS